MASRIHVLPDHLKNQIAAGEVIERPASVVKELLENSLDAGATRVVVEVDGGGVERIRVVDDGCGMSPEDAATALLRHATSKLSGMEDLGRIRTLGFRGEALPSIASVSRFELRTREAGTAGGVAVAVTGGLDLRARDTGMATGTEVEVQDLFFNVPARRKFLKTASTEAGRITEIVQQLALGRPGVHFTLLVDGRRVLDAPPVRGELERIHAIFGARVCEQLFECASGGGEVTVDGFVSAPSHTRATRGGMFTYVNGRFVRDRVIQAAVAAGYGSLLPRGRHPVTVLRVTLDPGLVDVNVHPAKSEVRFVNAGAVHVAVSRTVSLTMADTPWIAAGTAPAGPAAHVREETRGWEPGPRPRPSRHEAGRLLDEMRAAAAPAADPADASFPWEREPPIASVAASGYHASLRFVGQVGGCFLLLEGNGELVVVDQHAAHERVLYERLRAQREDRRPDVQRLLVPRVVELPPHLAARLVDRCGLLERLGFLVEPFGGNSFAVQGVPPDLRRTDPDTLLREVAEQLVASGVDRAEALEAAWDRVLATLACKAAIKAGDAISPEEARDLLRSMDATALSTYCPHGRPAVARFSMDQVARWFHR